LQGRLKLSDAERATLGEIGHGLGRKVLAEVATVARPDTILAWYRKLVARKFEGTQARGGPGRPRLKREVEQLIGGALGQVGEGGVFVQGDPFRRALTAARAKRIRRALSR
jgi:hypothetical protein